MNTRPSDNVFMSHSAWSAWIEIIVGGLTGGLIGVALRLECVDRNVPLSASATSM